MSQDHHDQLPGPQPEPEPGPSNTNATPQPQPGPSHANATGESRKSYTEDLVDGINYRVMPGKQANSKLVVKGGLCYKLDKKAVLKSGQMVLYLKCKYSTCKGRAMIIERHLKTNEDTEHTCPKDGANTAHWRALECLTIMKERASREASTDVQEIYNEVTANESRLVKEELNVERCRKAMNDARSKLIPPCPPTLEEVIPKLENNEYPESYQKIYLGHVKWSPNSRSSQSSQSRRRRVERKVHYSIFIGDKDLVKDVIKTATFFFGDATFKIVCRQARVGSRRSSQVLNILADYQGKCVCILQVIMTCRKFGMYKAVCQKIREMFPDFQPHHFMIDYEAAFRKAVQCVWPDTRILGCRFHFAKCLFAKLKSKFRLAGFFRRTGSVLQQRISSVLRQYFALPLIKHQHMRGECERLERELRSLCRTQTRDVAKRLNCFHNYVISYWMSLQGAYTVSVEGVEHKTNNISERFNQRLAAEMPLHPTLFKFFNCVQKSVIGHGFSIVAQTDGGRQCRTKLAKAAKHLLQAAVEVEKRYQEGDMSAQDVLRCAAAHFDNHIVVEAFVTYARSLEESELVSQPEEDEDDEQGEEDQEVSNADVSQPVDEVDELEVDERLRELQEDPDLQDVDPEVWVTTEWPIVRGNVDQPLSNRILEGERLEDVAVVVCQVCLVAHDNLVNMEAVRNGVECTHLLCVTCFNLVTECPTCKAPKGNSRGKKINVSSLMILRRSDVESNYGVTQQMMEDAARVTRRAGDKTDLEFFQRRNREAIQEALIEDGQDGHDVDMFNLSFDSTSDTVILSRSSSPTPPTPPSPPRPAIRVARGRGRGRGRGRRGALSQPDPPRGPLSQQEPPPGPLSQQEPPPGPLSQQEPPPGPSQDRSRTAGRGTRGALSQQDAQQGRSEDRSRSGSRLNRSLRTDEIVRLINADSDEDFQM